MKRFFLTGQRTFENRGCEALVRSTAAMLSETFDRCEILVPSDDIARDAAQWPEARDFGVRFVEAYMPAYTKYWVHLQRLPLSALKRARWPFPYPLWLKDQIRGVDAVLAIGGDNYSLDYRLPSLTMGIDRLAMDMGKPVFLWGASVGPFEAEPHFVPVIRDHLSRMAGISVRESVSYEYLTGVLGLSNVIRTVDSAFTLDRQPVDTGAFWPTDGGAGVLGLNISPLIERYRREGQNLREEAAAFIRDAVRQGFGVLLVPHVVPTGAGEGGSDALYMQSVLADLTDLEGRVQMMPSTLNASQIKQVISGLRFFVGARTHATIAALSSCVPTVSIAYSVKAKGINKDLFGDRPVVLDTPLLSRQTLADRLNYLMEHEGTLRHCLTDAIPKYRTLVNDASMRLRQIL